MHTSPDFPLFAGLDDKGRSVITAHAYEQTFHAGSDIYNQGDSSENLYLVSKGDVIITHQLDGDVVTLAKIEAGFFFGEEGILSPNQRHQTRARAATDATLTVISARQFEKLQSEYSDIASVILKNLARTISERLDEDTLRIGILSAISQIVLDPDRLNNIKKLAEDVLTITLKAIPSERAFLGIFKSGDTGHLTILASAGITPKQLPRELPVDSDHYLQQLEQQDGEIKVPAKEYDSGNKVFYAKRNILGRTIILESSEIGVVLLADKNNGDFSNQNSLALQIIASQIALALNEAQNRSTQKARDEMEHRYVGL